MQICIVTNRHVSYNPRVVKEADTLTKAGHNVTVATVCNNQRQALLDEKIIASRTWSLLTIKYRRKSIGENFRWLYTGIRQRFFASLLAHVGNDFGVVERALGREYPELKRLACSIPADLYIAHHVETLGVAYAAAMKNNAGFAFDAEDFHSEMFNALSEKAESITQNEQCLPKTVRLLLEEVETVPKSREQQQIEYLERKYLPHCVYITAASDGIADAYSIKYRLLRPITILNVFPLEMKGRLLEEGAFKSDTDETVQKKKPISLYWYSQVIGPGRGLEDAIRALALLSIPCELHLRGTAQQEYIKKLQALAKNLSVEGSVFFHLPSPPDELIAEAACHDIGLALETGKDLNNLLASSNKMFTYMNAGNAIVATATPGQLSVMAHLPGAGVLSKINDPISLAAAIEVLVSDLDRLRSVQESAREAAETRFNWEVESKKLLEIICKLS